MSMEQIMTPVNRAKYDLSQPTAQRSIERDRLIERYNVAIVESAMECCKPSKPGKRSECDCETKPVGEPFEPVGLLPVSQPFDGGYEP